MTDEAPIAPGPGARRRGGRRPGSSRSPQKILDAARLAFAANGYAETSLRGIAREAGVDPSLIVHFFGSKAGLFAAVVEWPYDATQVAAQVRDVAPEQIGEYTARTFISNWEPDEQRNPVISLIRAALADPTVAALLREFITVNFGLPLVEHVEADQPELRAAMLASQLIGFGLARYALAFEALTTAPTEQLIATLGQSLQHTYTNPLPVVPRDQ
jgi:AcrR family transcriptional regulator